MFSSETSLSSVRTLWYLGLLSEYNIADGGVFL